MRALGQLFLVLGALVGALVGFGILFGVHLPGVPWLVAVGLEKLTLAGSLGLMGAGAVLQRLARRAEERERLAAGSAPWPDGRSAPR